MLDALKFAFEILIVGALAIPWVAVLCLTFPDTTPTRFKFDLSFVPDSARSAVSIALVLAFGYLLGSAVSRFSRDFFNDELWQPLPTEDAIRDSVYFDEFCSEHWFVYTTLSKPIHLTSPVNFCVPPSGKSSRNTDLPKGPRLADLSQKELSEFNQKVEEVFQLQNSQLLLEGVDKVDRLKQYFDQITVLRGAAFNGFVLFALALFGSLGILKERWKERRALAFLTFLPGAVAAVLTLHSLWVHCRNNSQSIYSDPPLAETVILLLSVVGAFMTWNPSKAMPYLRICITGLLMMVISFGGWWWTEVMYDLQVIHSLSEVKYNGERQPTGEPQLIMKLTNPPESGSTPQGPDTSTPTQTAPH